MDTAEKGISRFEEWIRGQAERDDPLGDLARHVCAVGCAPDLMDRCRRHHDHAHLETHLDRSLPVLGMRQAWAEWSAENLRAVMQRWPAVLKVWSQKESVTKKTWLPTEAEFPTNRKVRIEVDDQRVNLSFHDREDLQRWNRDDQTVALEAVLLEVTGRPYSVYAYPGDGRMPWNQQ